MEQTTFTTRAGRKQLEQIMVAACRSIEASETPPSLAELAHGAGLSPWHFQRAFKKIIGITPKQYASTLQAKRFREELGAGASVTEAQNTAGYSSSSRAHDASRKHLAMTPTAYKAGAAGETICYAFAPCFLGWAVVAATERGVCAVEFADFPEVLPRMLAARFPKARLIEAEPELAELVEHVVDVIEGRGVLLSLPLDIRGTAFQKQVWRELQDLRPGEAVSYSQIAERIGRPEAVRAVAGAVASNKLGVLIPCHRIMRKDGSMGGYRWGEERKQQILDKEQEGNG